MSNQLPQPLPQPAEPDHKPIEEQKTRLWALSFESTKQVIKCQSCGATNVVPRLVQDNAAAPVRRINERVEISAPAAEIQRPKHTPEERKVFALAALSTILSATLIGVLCGQKIR